MCQSLENFRHNVKSVMEERGLSIQDLADKVGCHRPAMSRVLSGKEGVSVERAERIAKALGMPLAAMLAEKFQPAA